MNVEIYKDAKGEFRWRLRARNGRIIADSAEGYKQRADLIAAIKLLSTAGAAFYGAAIEQQKVKD
jgi:uncharacterized protein YegP (UPF0339 family)